MLLDNINIKKAHRIVEYINQHWPLNKRIAVMEIKTFFDWYEKLGSKPIWKDLVSANQSAWDMGYNAGKNEQTANNKSYTEIPLLDEILETLSWYVANSGSSGRAMAMKQKLHPYYSRKINGTSPYIIRKTMRQV